ncbi:unnamed protein product [Rhizophagus irregularis]|nr:unnamed protein product [Rhizophagus irregularis]
MTLNNYLLPRQSNSISVRAHHHPVWVAVAGVSRTEIRDHPDGHYCLVSVKSVKQFANVFADMSVVISQDDKAKIGLRIPAVGNGQKLILSVYLIIRLNESNDELRTGKLAIYGIAILSGKLAGIILPIDHFGTHLNTQGKVINPELALQNFKYAGEALCDIWRHVLSFGRSVDARYVEELVNLFEDLHFEGIDKENAEQQKKRTKRTKIIQQNVLCHGHRLKIIVTYANILLILNDAQI